jgi:hypothetical protein
MDVQRQQIAERLIDGSLFTRPQTREALWESFELAQNRRLTFSARLGEFIPISKNEFLEILNHLIESHRILDVDVRSRGHDYKILALPEPPSPSRN